MMSTPAVFCAPAASTKSTPYLATPAMFQHEAYPWAVRTPEASPMFWGVAPSSGIHANELSQETPGPLVSRELLRTVCEPFFEQMVTAVQQALLQKQMNEGSKEGHMMQVAQGAPFQSLHYECHTSFCAPRQLSTMLDEESTEADELGAFASLLSGTSSDMGSTDAMEPKSPETEASVPQVPGNIFHEDSEQASDHEKSTMVCRHWKSKGWCRMESNCKFLHPEHKRGVGAKSSGDGCTGGGISGAVCLGMSTTLSQSDVASAPTARRKRRGGKGRSNRGQQAQFDEPEAEATDMQL